MIATFPNFRLVWIVLDYMRSEISSPILKCMCIAISISERTVIERLGSEKGILRGRDVAEIIEINRKESDYFY